MVSLHYIISNRNKANKYSLLFCKTKEMTLLVRLSRVDRSEYRFRVFGDKNLQPEFLH